MALNSSDVSGGDTALASQYNSLIDDIEQHVHGGVDTTKVDATDLDTYPLDQDVSTSGTPTFVTIALGGNEAMEWDVVEFDLDGTSPDSVAYTLDGVKCKALSSTGYDVNVDVLNSNSDTSLVTHTYTRHDGTNLLVYHGAGYIAGDDIKVIIFTTV